MLAPAAADRARPRRCASGRGTSASAASTGGRGRRGASHHAAGAPAARSDAGGHGERWPGSIAAARGSEALEPRARAVRVGAAPAWAFLSSGARQRPDGGARAPGPAGEAETGWDATRRSALGGRGRLTHLGGQRPPGHPVRLDLEGDAQVGAVVALAPQPPDGIGAEVAGAEADARRGGATDGRARARGAAGSGTRRRARRTEISGPMRDGVRRPVAPARRPATRTPRVAPAACPDLGPPPATAPGAGRIVSYRGDPGRRPDVRLAGAPQDAL